MPAGSLFAGNDVRAPIREIIIVKRTVLLKLIVRVGLVAIGGAAAAIVVLVHWSERKSRRIAVGPNRQAVKALSTENPPSSESFRAGFDVPPKRPAEQFVMGIETAAASEAADGIEDDDLVLGVKVAGQARAYPVGGMSLFRYEVINDNLGGALIAVTY